MEPSPLPHLTVSGYRGIWGETLTHEIVAELTNAFAHFVDVRVGKRILIGRDARTSGSEIRDTIVETLTHLGFTVTDIGVVATPVVLFLTRDHAADGAIVVTASHNPIEYNGLKFVNRDGVFLSEKEVAEMKSYIYDPLPTSERVGTVTLRTDLTLRHREKVLASVDVSLIRAQKFRVVLDPINSVGAIETPELLAALGCSTTMINGEPNGLFAHEPEPVPKNLTDLGTAVREAGADIGFAQDPDGDRLVLVDETGTVVLEEYTLALAVQAVLEREPGDVVINLSTSNMCEDIAKTFGKKTFRTKVGEANVLAGIRAHHAVIGGEGSGGVIYPKVNETRDSFVAIALILELLARHKKQLSHLIAELPRYARIKEKHPLSISLDSFYTDLTDLWSDAAATLEDGIRLDWPDRSWIHIRASNTEPIVRIIGEATSSARIEQIAKETVDLIYGEKYLTAHIK
jgi:phosphomannomutase